MRNLIDSKMYMNDFSIIQYELLIFCGLKIQGSHQRRTNLTLNAMLQYFKILLI